MFGLEIIETVIGIVFVYLLLSLLVTTLNELYFTYINRLRSKILEEGLKGILSDNNELSHLDSFKEHPLIKKKIKKGRFPSYISANTFGKVLTDILGIYNSSKITYEEVKNNISALPKGDFKTMLTVWIQHSDESLDKFQSNIEEWYNEVMDRIVGWYKRVAKRITLIMGFCCAVFFNADTFYMVEKLANDDAARKQIVAAAEKFNADNELKIISAKNKIDSLDIISTRLIQEMNHSSNILGIGWNEHNTPKWKRNALLENLKHILIKLIGWILTTIAISLGAPFWYDILSKAIRLKGSGKKPKRLGDES